MSERLEVYLDLACLFLTPITVVVCSVKDMSTSTGLGFLLGMAFYASLRSCAVRYLKGQRDTLERTLREIEIKRKRREVQQQSQDKCKK